jgi:hypothetical protein
VPAHANLVAVLVSMYQKDGVAVRTAGSTLNMYWNQVVNRPSAVIASNGIEVIDGPVGDVRYNSVSGNECTLPVVCGGGDPTQYTEASGILTFAADPATVLAGNWVKANDMGIYTDDNIRIRDNQVNDNRSTGIYVDTDSSSLKAIDNTTDRNRFYGIAIGPLFPIDQGGTGLPNPGGNLFIDNTALGNAKYDLWQSNDAGPNVNEDNHCATAYPSTTYWDCEPEEHGNDGDRDDQGDAAFNAGAMHSSAAATPRLISPMR